MPHKTYNTPKRKCVVKTRLTEDERRAFEDKCAALSMSQSEYIRQAVFYSRISPVIRVTAHSEEMLTAISSLVAQYGKIGSNLNQIARYLNEYGAPYNALSSEVRAAVSDLAALKFEVLKVIAAHGSVRNNLPYRLRRNPLREQRMAEKGIVTKGLRCDCFLMLRRYEDKIGFIECKVPVPVFCRCGKSPETHVITLSRHLSRRDNCQHVMKQA